MRFWAIADAATPGPGLGDSGARKLILLASISWDPIDRGLFRQEIFLSAQGRSAWPVRLVFVFWVPMGEAARTVSRRYV